MKHKKNIFITFSAISSFVQQFMKKLPLFSINFESDELLVLQQKLFKMQLLRKVTKATKEGIRHIFCNFQLCAAFVPNLPLLYLLTLLN